MYSSVLKYVTDLHVSWTSHGETLFKHTVYMVKAIAYIQH